ncbi:MAG: mechanosensitive ion channel family protein [Nocardioidaceae bacterium]|nr:mechanosensitive ion channel family protein [Nocardioidaceae bacterium]
MTSQQILSVPTGLLDELRQSRFAENWADYFVVRPITILGLLILGWALRWAAFRAIDRITVQAAEGSVPGVLSRNKASKEPEASAIATARREQRAGAMSSLLKSIVTIMIATIVGFMVISQLGYDIAPLIASAGIIGVALGFGAQSLVKDFLLGIFMILEDQYGVGDSIDLGEASGTVEAVGLRVTRLRDVNGTVWYVRNGEVLRVGNMSQNWARTVLDIPVAYTADLDQVRTVLRDIAHDVWEDPDFRNDVIEEPEVWGVERLDPDGVVMRVVLKTAPLEQWTIAREMRERIKERFDVLGIEIPLPQRVVWHRDPPGTDAPDSSTGSNSSDVRGTSS